MRDFLFHMRSESKAAAITCIVVGILFIIWPGSALVFLLRILALLLLVEGVICLSRMLKAEDVVKRNGYMLPSVVCLLLGFVLLVAPRFVGGILPFLFGLFLLYHGVKGILTARNVMGSSTIGVLASIVMLIFGIVLILHPFGALKVMMVVAGIALLYDGVVMLGLTNRYSGGGGYGNSGGYGGSYGNGYGGSGSPYAPEDEENIIDVEYKEK